MEKRNPAFLDLLLTLEPGQSQVFNFRKGLLDEKLLITATFFTTNGKTDKLVSLQNVEETLDETESIAWQKLLNVMTHEIMNSVAPISSLADTLKNNWNRRKTAPIRILIPMTCDWDWKRSKKKRRTAALCHHLPQPE